MPRIPKTLVFLGEAIEVDADAAEWKWRKKDRFVVAASENGRQIFVFAGPEKLLKNPTCTRGTRIQSYLFDREKYTPAKATSWLKRHGLKTPRAHVTADYLHYRQEPPSHFKKSGFRTKEITGGIQAIVGCPVEKWSTNPAAEALFKRFNHRSPTGSQAVQVPNAKQRIGRVHHIAYRSTKFGPCQSFIHVFEKSPWVWVDSESNPRILVITGGNIKITKRGIEG